MLISLPLAVAISRAAWLRGPALGLASIVQTIPGLALLALFYPLLLALSVFTERAFGFGFRALGFLPALLALTLYSMLPVLRNTVTALAGIDPAIRTAARGVGMTPRQSLLLVELPLAAPVIMAGMRTAAVWVIGTATLSTPVGQTSLGNYIFTGLQTENWVFVLFGCVAAALLALVIDRLLALAEDGFAHALPCAVDRCRGGTGADRGRQPLAAVRAAKSTQSRRDQELRRAIHPGRPDGRPAREGRRSGRCTATASARPSSSARSPPTTSTSMSTIPARSGRRR